MLEFTQINLQIPLREFTLRAFLNGHLDLSLSENGGFSSVVRSLRTKCINLPTEIEACLDFDDEMPPLDFNLIMDKIHNMSQDVQNALEMANYHKLLCNLDCRYGLEHYSAS
ncbi:hypothetical protein VNO78_20437 [Psophocarpus tetragonolobus]|uniref:Uncharacterized protein n=1 Tax=Psophocarpus tetragonolobus TaxID=3891 RepID=A0AAN9SAC5_PSOTE